MISIITPIYNSEQFLSDAIKSVLQQTYWDWELLLVNDGSRDQSKRIALSFNDKRIRYFEQDNKGVSAARNIGLANMKGNYFCFLDADDLLPKDSLKSRRVIFSRNPSINFVDGTVYKMDSKMENVEGIWKPDLFGNPFSDLVKLAGKSFFGPSWMIKREKGQKYMFDENLSHAEDLLFYMKLARKGGTYAYTSDLILYYRNAPNSAMTNLTGLERGYRYIENKIGNWDELSINTLNVFKFKYKKAMCLAYLRRRQLIRAVLAIF